jgi:peptidoglycan/LPS O-acetylase OafA/YrhL
MAGIVALLIKTGWAAYAGEWGKPALFLAALAPTLFVSWLSHRYLELGATNWIRRKIDGYSQSVAPSPY